MEKFIVFIVILFLKRKKSRIFAGLHLFNLNYFFFTSNIKILLLFAKIKVKIKICKPALFHLFNFDGANVTINLNNYKKYHNYLS